MTARALVATLATRSHTHPAPAPRTRRPRLTLLAAPLAVLVVAALLASAAHAQDGPLGARQLPAGDVPGELIVKFRPGLDTAARVDALDDRHVRLKRSLPVARTALVSVPGGAPTGPAIRALERDPRVAWAGSICCGLSYDAYGSKPKSSLVIGQNA